MMQAFVDNQSLASSGAASVIARLEQPIHVQQLTAVLTWDFKSDLIFSSQDCV